MERTCLTCGNVLIKRNHESEPRFQKKRFCSAVCGRAYLKKNKLGWWSHNSADNRLNAQYEKEAQV